MTKIEDINKFCISQNVKTETDLIRYANGLVSKFGGKVLPSNEPKRNIAGFVWVYKEDQKEIVINPVIRFSGNFDSLSKKLLKVGK